jgi:transcription initiation factor TFIIB
MACRENNSDRTFKEICNLTKVSKKDIGKCVKVLTPLAKELGTEMSTFSHEATVHRFCSQLDLGQEIISAAIKVLFAKSSLLKLLMSVEHWQESLPSHLSLVASIS